ncbi:MAG TPA: transcriptional regulator [Chitinophagaceae bacterium]|nr:transcriptional regulator [Chitinophagaceae bacterium]
MFDSRVHLGIMSVLMVNTHLNYHELKELIAVNEGNLASHPKNLEEHAFINVRKGFIGKKPIQFILQQQGVRKLFIGTWLP